ncbi:MAG: UDP-3-O-(3-hydroxymyristoyl)glucosamine N-acyltransferase [Halomonadaceae bacterium]|nr:MAG: UDP-3-O-(3-hydroxymyristoyl)glucosamine N-acyltransferase [Halomonadaceae bacterium]
MTNATLTLAEIADLLGAELKGAGDTPVDGISTLAQAGPSQVAFLSNPRYLQHLANTRAAAVLVAPEHADQCPGCALVLADPYYGFARLSHHFATAPVPAAGVHPRAVVHEQAQVDPSAIIGPNVVVEQGARIAPGVEIGPNCVIGARSQIGENSWLGPNVTLYHDVIMGARCRIAAGAVIGSDGFGYANHQGQWQRIAQLGGVTLGDDVDVGANTTIDRGALEDTCIGNGVKLDNLIQIAHNVQIGDHCAMAAFVGIAGSTRIGSHCVFGGASGVGGHLTIGNQVHLTGMTMVTRSLETPGVYSSGTGVDSNRNWRRNVVRFRQLDEMAKRVKALEKKLNE